MLSFYRKALEDQGLSVPQADDPPQADGAEPDLAVAAAACTPRSGCAAR
ncbi:MAG: hypothetical protein U0168_26050 [Nannocystaceae bacterium]